MNGQIPPMEVLTSNLMPWMITADFDKYYYGETFDVAVTDADVNSPIKTLVSAINNIGIMVGQVSYRTTSGKDKVRAFRRLVDGTTSVLDYNNGFDSDGEEVTLTTFASINNFGYIVGRYETVNNVKRGFLVDPAMEKWHRFEILNPSPMVAGAAPNVPVERTALTGINDDFQIIGFYRMLVSGDTLDPNNPSEPLSTGPVGIAHGFHLRMAVNPIVPAVPKNANDRFEGGFLTFLDPYPLPSSTLLTGINGWGDIVGTEKMVKTSNNDQEPAHGFLLPAGDYGRTINIGLVVSGLNESSARGTSSDGHVAGYYTLDSKEQHGFIWQRFGSFNPENIALYSHPPTTFTPMTKTSIFGINDKYALVGSYTESGNQHGFVMYPRGLQRYPIGNQPLWWWQWELWLSLDAATRLGRTEKNVLAGFLSHLTASKLGSGSAQKQLQRAGLESAISELGKMLKKLEGK